MPETTRQYPHREAAGPQSLNTMAAQGPVLQPQRSQLSLLIRHFLERFFNHETLSGDGDGKARVIQMMCAAGLPGMMVAIYLWPVYHPLPGWPPGHTEVGPPPYWVQLNHHFFFVMLSFGAMGLATVFEWDLFFPDRLDVFVLGTLPVAGRKVFLARIAAIATFVAGFLIATNVLPPLILPAATDPPSLGPFVCGHVAATVGSGLFAAVFILALQGVMVSLLGERLFRRISLAMQGLLVTLLIIMLLLFPVLSGVTPALLRAGGPFAHWFPPFWFLGIYQRLLDGPSSLPIFHELARTGCLATLAVTLAAVTAYPLAYLRRVRRLVEGAGTRSTRNRMIVPLHGVLHATAVRPPVRRAIFHFIGQTLLRVPRFQIYLVLYGGVGLAALIATILRFRTVGQQVSAEVSANGIRIGIGVVAFWVIAGLQTTFVASGNQRGSWILRAIHGRPAEFESAIEQLMAAKVWVWLCGTAVTMTAIAAMRLVAPSELLAGRATGAQVLVGCGMCLLLTDAFFLNVTAVPFTGDTARQHDNLAFTVLRYFTFFPVVETMSVASVFLVEKGARNFGVALICIVVAHLWFRKRHRELVKIYSDQLELEEGEEESLLTLGLRY